MAHSARRWHGRRVSESQKVTKQPALTTASGSIWLLVAGIIAVICLVLLWLMRDLDPPGAATIGIVTIIVMYLVMVAIRYGVHAPRVRVWGLALLTLAIVAAFLAVATLTIAIGATFMTIATVSIYSA